MHRGGMLKCKTTSTPMSIINKIIRLDISFVVNRVCQYFHASCGTHYSTIKHIVCYVWLTLSYGLHLWSNPSGVYFAFSDADCTSSLDDRRSTWDMLCPLDLI
jgi:hypothetical protein